MYSDFFSIDDTILDRNLHKAALQAWVHGILGLYWHAPATR